MKTPYKLLAIALLTLSLSCCKRDDDAPSEPITLLAPQEVKDYVLFQPGTYWVYENSITQELDSVYVYETLNEITRFEGDGQIVDFEQIIVNTFSEFEQYNHKYKLDAPVLEALQFYNPRIKRVKTKPGDYVGETIVLFHPYNVGDKRYPLGTNGYVELIDFKLSFELGGNIYQEVLIYKNVEDASEGYKNVNYYFAKHIGLIKREIIDNTESWELIRYNIVKE